MKVLALTRAPGSACEYYRGIGILSKIPGVEIRIAEEVNWTVLSQVDLLFAERPCSESDREIVQMARDFGVPVWVEVDDDFFSVPGYNPARNHFWKEDVQQRHAECLAMADIVTVTTEHLRGQLLDFNKNIRVVPNAFNDYHWKWEFKPGTKNLVAWRGSATHRNDIRRYLDSMATVQKLNNLKDQGWVFVGNDLWYVEERLMPKVTRFIDELPTTVYWKAIKSFGAKFWHVPLLDNKFNRSKSNISWIEATYAGAVCLCPDLDEWRNPGAILYEPENEEGLTPPMAYPGKAKAFEAAFTAMLEMSDSEREDALRQSFEYIADNLLLSKVNEKRKEILEGLCAS